MLWIRFGKYHSYILTTLIKYPRETACMEKRLFFNPVGDFILESSGSVVYGLCEAGHYDTIMSAVHCT